VLAILIAVAAILLHSAISPLTGRVETAICASAFLVAAWMALSLLAQMMQATALLEATEDEIVVHNAAGRITIPWGAVETITVANRLPGDWLRIRLRAGTHPGGSLLARIWSTSPWERRTISIPLVTTFRQARLLAEDLELLRASRAQGATQAASRIPP
jgi:hypothetical protein